MSLTRSLVWGCRWSPSGGTMAPRALPALRHHVLARWGGPSQEGLGGRASAVANPYMSPWQPG